MKLVVTSLMLLSSWAFASSELDNEKQVTNVSERAKDLPATLIMRKNEKTGEVQVVHLKQTVGEKQLNESELKEMRFQTVAMDQQYSEKQFNELDQDRSRESWYFYYGYYGYGYGYPYYYYPNYYYYGTYYPYYPYYNYYWGGYSYYYYRPCCWW